MANLENWLRARALSRSNLLYLCNNVLGFGDVSRNIHGPTLDLVQQFPMPPLDRLAEFDMVQPGQANWTYTRYYRPFTLIDELPGPRRRMLLDCRGFLKCQPASEMVRTKNNGFVSVGDIKVGEKVVSIDDNFETVIGTVLAKEYQGYQRCLRLKMRSGREIVVSDNHPLRMIDGWIEAGNLRVHDKVAALGRVPTPDQAPYLPHAEITGWLLGDGCFKSQVVSNDNPYFRAKICMAAVRAGGTAYDPNYKGDKCGCIRLQGLRPLFRDLGLIETGAREKFIPEEFFKVDDQSVSELLYGLFMSDGTFGRMGISYTSVSKKMVQQVQQLLLRFSLVGQMYSNTNSFGEVYHLSITSKPQVMKFLHYIGWDKASGFKFNVKTNPNIIDVIPKGWRKLYPKYFFPRGEKPYEDSRSLTKYGLSKDRAYRLGMAIQDSRLIGLASPCTTWDEIWSIEDTGFLPTWDLEIDTHNYALNDIITHNTTINCQAHAIQWLLNYPDIAMLMCSSNTKKSQLIIGEIKQLFLSNDVLRNLFPDYCPSAKVKEWGNLDEFTLPNRQVALQIYKSLGLTTVQTRKEPSMITGALEKGAASMHFEVIKFTDVVEPNNVLTKEAMQSVSDSIDMAKNLLGKPRHWIDLEGTRYKYGDAYGNIIKQEASLPKEKRKWSIMVRGVYVRDVEKETFGVDELSAPYKKDEDGQYISRWPERFPVEDLEHERYTNPSNFASQKLNNPAADDSNRPFPPDLLKFKSRREFEVTNIVYQATTIDTAETDGVKSDFTVMTTCGWDFEGRLWVHDIRYGRFLPDQIIDLIFKIDEKYRISGNHQGFKLEETGFTRGLMAGIGRRRDLTSRFPRIQLMKRDNQQSKIERILNTLQPYYHGGDILFLEDLDCREQLVTEFGEFPKGTHDDILDTIADQFQGKQWYGKLAGQHIDTRVLSPHEQYLGGQIRHSLGEEAEKRLAFRQEAEMYRGLGSWGQDDGFYDRTGG